MGFFLCVFKLILSLGIMIFVGVVVDRAFKKRECKGKKKCCQKKKEEEEEEIAKKSEKRAEFKNMMKNVEDEEEEEDGEEAADLSAPPLEADRHKKWMEEMKVYNVDQPKASNPQRMKEIMAKKQQMKKTEEEVQEPEPEPKEETQADEDDDSDDGVDGKDAISSFMDQMLDDDGL